MKAAKSIFDRPFWLTFVLTLALVFLLASVHFLGGRSWSLSWIDAVVVAPSILIFMIMPKFRDPESIGLIVAGFLVGTVVGGTAVVAWGVVSVLFFSRPGSFASFG